MSHRKSTPRGQMSRSSNSGPAIMMMPPHIRETFMPNPPLGFVPPVKKKRTHPISGVAQFLVEMERTKPPTRKVNPTPKELREKRRADRKSEHEAKLNPLVEAYRSHQTKVGGEFEGMNCYNTLFVGRLAYEVTERKLLREFEAFGPIKDLKLIKESKENKSRGYAFVEFEHDTDMKRAFRAADGMRLEGREIVVDVERGHTVPNWLPRRLGGGLGGTRLGGKDKNVTMPGRFDPSRPEASRPTIMGGGMGRGGGGPPPPYGRGGGGGGGYDQYGGGRPQYDRPYDDRRGPPPPYGRGRGGYDQYGSGPPSRGGHDWDRRGPPPPRDDRKRYRSRSPPDQRHHHSRRRY